MARVLILGCSYTNGSYSFHANGDEERCSNIAWHDTLPEEITLYTGRGIGYIQWVDILETIDITQFDAVLLQESLEPKFQLLKDAHYITTTHATEFRPPLTRHELDKSSIVYSKGIKHRQILQQMLGIEDSPDIDYIHSIGNNDSSLNIVKSCASYINAMLHEAGIPTYIIKSHEHVDFSKQHTHCKFLDMEPFFNIVGDDKSLVNTMSDGGQGHFTEKGSQLLAVHVADAWKRREK